MKDDIAITLASIVIWFVLMLLGKKIIKKQWCAVCAAVTASWLMGSVAYVMGWFDGLYILAVLMGESAVGWYYLIEKKLPITHQIFRLPILLTLTYMVLVVFVATTLYSIGILLGIWILFGLLFVYQTHPRIKSTVDAIIACCRNW